MFAALQKPEVHRAVLLIAIPMVLSNITVPLLGLVDTAVIGHLDHAWYLGGVALGNAIITCLYFLMGFLRMSATGLNAQAFGASDQLGQVKVLVQGLLIACVLSLLLLIFHKPLVELIFYFSNASEQVELYAKQYYAIRIYGAPAALTNLLIIGWLLGTQEAKMPMWIIIITNVINIILDITLVLGLGYAVKGVAAASTIADYCALIISTFCIRARWRTLQLPNLLPFSATLLNSIIRFVELSRDIFLRSVCLQLVFAFMAFHGASLGDDVVAANAILMSFLMLISYGLDGFAYAIESLVGKAIGARDKVQLYNVLFVTTFWAVLISTVLTILFATSGEPLISTITSIESVQVTATQFMPWLVAFPLVAMWCFLLDGVFVGATKAKEMRNSMFLSCGFFFLVVFGFSDYGNHALWAAMLSFMLMRNITLGYAFIRLCQNWGVKDYKMRPEEDSNL